MDMYCMRGLDAGRGGAVRVHNNHDKLRAEILRMEADMANPRVPTRSGTRQPAKPTAATFERLARGRSQPRNGLAAKTPRNDTMPESQEDAESAAMRQLPPAYRDIAQAGGAFELPAEYRSAQLQQQPAPSQTAAIQPSERADEYDGRGPSRGLHRHGAEHRRTVTPTGSRDPRPAVVSRGLRDRRSDAGSVSAVSSSVPYRRRILTPDEEAAARKVPVKHAVDPARLSRLAAPRRATTPRPTTITPRPGTSTAKSTAHTGSAPRATPRPGGAADPNRRAAPQPGRGGGPGQQRVSPLPSRALDAQHYTSENPISEHHYDTSRYHQQQHHYDTSRYQQQQHQQPRSQRPLTASVSPAAYPSAPPSYDPNPQLEYPVATRDHHQPPPHMMDQVGSRAQPPSYSASYLQSLPQGGVTLRSQVRQLLAREPVELDTPRGAGPLVRRSHVTGNAADGQRGYPSPPGPASRPAYSEHDPQVDHRSSRPNHDRESVPFYDRDQPATARPVSSASTVHSGVRYHGGDLSGAAVREANRPFADAYPSPQDREHSVHEKYSAEPLSAAVPAYSRAVIPASRPARHQQDNSPLPRHVADPTQSRHPYESRSAGGMPLQQNQPALLQRQFARGPGDWQDAPSRSAPTGDIDCRSSSHQSRADPRAEATDAYSGGSAIVRREGGRRRLGCAALRGLD